MGVSRENKKPEPKYIFQRKGGRSIIERKPVLSPDGESVLIIVENIVRVYNIQTGDCVRILEPESSLPHVLKDRLISIYFPDNEQHNLYGCSENGLITIWTWEKGAVLREKELQLLGDVKILTCDLIDNNECFITGTSSNRDNLYYATFSMRTGEQLYDYSLGSCIIYNGIIDVAIGTCNNDRFALICNGTKGVFVQNLIQPHVRSIVFNQNQIRVLSVATHSNENCIVFTDALGRATVARGNVYKYGELSFEVLHWHSLPLIACAFSLQGSYLLTGGLEGVLVKWSIGGLTNRANEKQFIPRLPGFIKFIAVTKSHIAITLTNNAVIVASSQLRVVSTILECGGLSPAARALSSSCLLYSRRARALLLGGRPGHVQLYSTDTDTVLYNIDITQQNAIPPSRHNLFPSNTEVTRAALSADGGTLVTSERRSDHSYGTGTGTGTQTLYPEERLKFWSATGDKGSPFSLNTCVNLSHGGCAIVSIAIDAAGTRCLTAGEDNKFRIWKRDEIKKSSNKKISWSCLTACYYSSGTGKSMAHDVLNKLKIRDYCKDKEQEFGYLTEYKEPDVVKQLIHINEGPGFEGTKPTKENSDMGGVAISRDGSVIAAWFGRRVTLWESSGSLRTALSHAAHRTNGLHLQFGHGDAEHYLACTTSECLSVWSVLSLSVRWVVRARPALLVADALSHRMAILTTTNDVFVFSPHSPSPLLQKECVLKPSEGVITCCTFVPTHNKDHIKLYMMRNDSELYCLEPENSEKGELEIISQRNLPQSRFSQLVAEQRLSDIRPPQTDDAHDARNAPPGNTTVTQVFSSAPHMLPPVSLLCSSFLELVSGRRAAPPDLTDRDPTSRPHDEDLPTPTSSDDEMDPTPDLPPARPPLWTPNYREVKEKRLRKILKQPLNIDVNSTIFTC